MKYLSAAHLEKLGACEDQVQLFRPGPRICGGCDLVHGLGFFSDAGELVQEDPAPEDEGIVGDGDWYCTEECYEYILTEEALNRR